MWEISVRGCVDPQGHNAAGRIRSTEKFNDLIGNQNRDLPAFNIVPQPTTLPRGPQLGRALMEFQSFELLAAFRRLVTQKCSELS
jgi:hypothetical protein